MIIAGVLFIIGAGLGCRYNVIAALLTSGFIAVGFIFLWLRNGELDAIKGLILAAYLSAYQAGYLTASYLTTPSNTE
ncbi:hypothetical protein [Methylobacterium planeticum]|uniref:Uncharacterized protein n=1 Tax=Methylobacterium planeticum TaxID=2615211 RepID=A0A6N6MGZ6_9HYPH|nr:hypothetical protein [Methylobacterium planeticum]KAB1070234.1 hypothetical protein F6X51_23475 [Methylobacterium planeticum]